MAPATAASAHRPPRAAALLCCLLLAGAACRGHELRVAAQIGTEPKFLRADSGAVTGLCPELLRAIERIDPTLKFSGDQQWMPVTRVITELAAGAQDVACALQHTLDRDRTLVYLEPPLFEVDYVLIARRDDPVHIANWDDLRKLQPPPTVLVNRGFAASARLESVPGIHVDASATDTRINLDKLLAGRARLYFHRGPGLPRMLERAGVADKVRVLPASLLHAASYLVLSKQLDAAVAERVRRALAQLARSGELQAIVRKWS